MNKTTKTIIFILVLALILWGANKFLAKRAAEVGPIRIGVVSAMTGDLGFYGESTRLGVLLAQDDLKNEGIDAVFIFEDAQTDAAKALNAAQKLVNIDKVRGIYSEFNPAAVAISSFVKGKNILHVYDAASVSSLADNPLVYKTYIDYTVNCRESANYLKSAGVTSVGVLEPNIEFGQLCTKGVKEIFPDATIETYNLGTTDFRTLLLKLKNNNVGAIFNASFAGETLTTLKSMKELGVDTPFIGEADAFSADTIAQNSSLLKKVIVFGLPPASTDFTEKIKKKFPNDKIGYIEAAALGYIHAKQIAHALAACSEDTQCIQDKMDASKPEEVIGFEGFTNHIAKFAVSMQQFQNGKFVDLK